MPKTTATSFAHNRGEVQRGELILLILEYRGSAKTILRDDLFVGLITWTKGLFERFRTFASFDESKVLFAGLSLV